MKRRFYLLILPLLLALNGCDTSSSSFEEASEEKQFVWNGMNLWYFWQNSVSDLDDDRFSDDGDFHDFLNRFSDEEQLFFSLLDPSDDFSWFIENYIEHEEARRGISQSFGFRYGLVRISDTSNDVFGYVQYVLPDSPAEAAGLQRGDVFNRVNGTQLTVNNFNTLLQNDNYTLTLAEIENGGFNELGETDNIQSVELQENPVFKHKIIETDAGKVGYLAFNAFRFNFHEELNSAFSQFQIEHISDLVIDLRYNSGGSLVTSAVLAGLISGLHNSNVFAQLIYNEKNQDRNTEFPIFDEVPVYDDEGNFDDWITMNHLNLNRVFVLTARWTASASEMLINGLEPYMDVIQIGSETRGKDEGSITVYDSPPNYNNRNEANPNHLRAMQPIVFKIFNSLEEDYPDGFMPSEENYFVEFSRTHLPNMRPLGDPDELLFSRALQIITGVEPVAKAAAVEFNPFGELIYDSGQQDPFSDKIYLLPGEVEEFGLVFD